MERTSNLFTQIWGKLVRCYYQSQCLGVNICINNTYKLLPDYRCERGKQVLRGEGFFNTCAKISLSIVLLPLQPNIDIAVAEVFILVFHMKYLT